MIEEKPMNSILSAAVALLIAAAPASGWQKPSLPGVVATLAPLSTTATTIPAPVERSQAASAPISR